MLSLFSYPPESKLSYCVFSKKKISKFLVVISNPKCTT